MAEVDPYEALIKLAAADADIASVTGGRVAMRHRYGQQTGDWSQTAASLVLLPAGGLQRTDVDIYEFQVEARCYGDTPYLAGTVLRALRDWTRNVAKSTVAVVEGTALVYYAIIASNARLIIDDDVRAGEGMPAYLVQLNAAVYGATV